MIIRNQVTKTLKASPLNSRGYEVPPDRWIRAISTLKGSPNAVYGAPLWGAFPPMSTIRRSCRPTAIER